MTMSVEISRRTRDRCDGKPPPTEDYRYRKYKYFWYPRRRQQVQGV